MRYRELNPVKISEPELTSSYSGQKDLMLRATDDGGKLVGYVTWTVYQGVPEIQMIEVHKSARRQGIAMAMVKRIADEYGGYDKIEWSNQTDEGGALKRELDRQFGGAAGP